MPTSSTPATAGPPRRRRRWPRRVAVVAAVLLVLGTGVTALAQLGTPWSRGAGDVDGVYASDEGRLRYQVHLPPQHGDGEQLPVLMAIHGCAMTGFGWNSMKETTQLNALADREGFVVVYPTQEMFADRINCWRSADPRDQLRGVGEPALLAGVAQQVVAEHDGDPDRVHVAGASSGAGAAVILGVTYPDVFASVTSVAGGEYGLNQVDPDDPGATPPQHTARQAWAQMGDRARAVPMLVIQGEADEVVPPLVGERLVEQWTAVHDLVDDGLLNDSLGLVPTSESAEGPDGQGPWTRTTWAAEGAEPLLEYYAVAGMGHVWSGPDGSGLFTDDTGPDASALFWAFAQAHPMR
jgi:poly(hydroxyalkanoate) depolymerase family esterase